MARTKNANRNEQQQQVAERPTLAVPVVQLTHLEQPRVVPEVAEAVDPQKPQDDENKKKQRKKKRKYTYFRPIFRVLRQIDPDMRISKRAMEIVNCFMIDVFERIASEAAVLVRYTKRKTITPLDVEGATKLVLNGGDLTKHAVHVGASAVVRFFNSTFSE